MNQLQEHYLFLVNNNIKTVEGLITYQVLWDLDVRKISDRQQELYQQKRARKRACKTKEDIREYQIWHMGIQEELDELKAEKKALNRNLRIVEGCVEEYKKFSMLDYSTIEDEIRHTIEVPEYPYAVVDEVVPENDTDLSVNNYEEEMIFYEDYKKRTPMEKAQHWEFDSIRSRETVQNFVKTMFFEMSYHADIDEFLEETESLYRGIIELVTKNKAEEVLGEVKRRRVPFDEWSILEKAEILQFQLDNNSYNIRLYNEVCKACGVDTSDADKMFEDYQAIYDKTVDMQSEQRMEKNVGDRGRAR